MCSFVWTISKTIVLFVLRKPALVTENERHARRKICEQCKFLDLAFKANTCKQCGCFIYPKTMLAASSCPILKWK